MRPKKSMTSRSNQLATGYFAAIDGYDGSLGRTGATIWRKDRKFGKNHRWFRRNRPLVSRSSLAKRERSRPLRPTVTRSAKSGNADVVVLSRSSPGRVSRTLPSGTPNAVDTLATIDITHDPRPRALPHG